MIKSKRLTKLIAGTVASALVVTSIVYFGSDEALAKETFQGIMEIAEENSEDSPFSVVEIVPGKATYTVGEGDEAVDIEIPMGTLGYYIKGEEPCALSENLALLPDGDARKAFADMFLKKDGDTLKGVLKDLAAEDDSAPLKYIPYEESYNYSISDGDIDLAESEGNPWQAVELDKDHEEILTDKIPSDSTTGIFTKNYAPLENEITDFTGLSATAALDSTTLKDGDFDPYFVHKSDNTGDYSAVFEASSAKRGYVVTEAVEVFSGDTTIRPDTPIYEPTGDGKYLYKGLYSTLDGIIPYSGDSSVSSDGAQEDSDDEDSDDDDDESESNEDDKKTVDKPSDDSNEETVEDTDEGSETDENEPSSDDSKDDESEKDDDNNHESDVSADEVASINTYRFELPFYAAKSLSDDTVSDDDIENKDKEDEKDEKNDSGKNNSDDESSNEDDEDGTDETNSSSDSSSKKENNGNEDESTVSDGSVSNNSSESTSDNSVSDDNIVSYGAKSPSGDVGSYYMLVFQYDPINPDENVCYRITSYDNTSDTSVKYSLDDKILFVPNHDKTGCVMDTGLVPDAFLYKYVGTSTVGPDNTEVAEYPLGNYDLIDGTSTPGLRVSGISLYFRGPFINNDWFRKYVFDREFNKTTGLLKDEFSISYECMTPDEFSSYEAGEIGLLYLSNPDGHFIPNEFTKDGTYGTDDEDYDFSNKTVKNILSAVVESNLPVIVDGTIIDGKHGTKDTKLQILARALQQKSIASLYAKYADKSASDLVSGIKDAKDWFNDDKNSHHVNGSIYVFNSDEEDYLLNNQFIEEFDDDLVDDGFKEIKDEIKTENEYRKANKKSGRISEEINEAVAIKYIIAYAKRKGAYVKEKVTVLEIQPCMVPEKQTKKTTGNLYVKETEKDDITYYSLCLKNDSGADQVILSEMENTIELVSMSSSEFVGREEDISSEYDLIYLGLATTYLNKNNGNVVYNDTKMNGLIYTNIGDYVWLDPALSGLLSRDVQSGRIANTYGANGEAGKARYSGNDISEIKVKKLKEYVDAGYPILCANGCFTNENKVNTKIIDKNSYWYSFLDELVEKKNDKYQFIEDNIFSMPPITSSFDQNFKDDLEWYLNLPKPSIELDTSYSKQGVAQDVYLEDGKYYMEYMFSITDKASTDTDNTYDCELYIDINSDGRFAAEEKRDEFVIQTAGGTKQFKNDKDRYKLKAGKDYYAYFEVTDEYDGPLPWKLVITSNDYEGRRDSEIGCYKIHRVGAEKLRVNVLQLIPDGTPTGLWNISDIKRTGSDGDQMSNYLKTLTDSLEHYDVKTTTMKNKDFVQALANARDSGTDFWSQYDLLILGFSEEYKILEDCDGDKTYKNNAKYAASSIISYIESGRSVLVGSGVVTNDISTLSYSGSYGAGARQKWGYNMTRRLRALIGMDRYGVSEGAKSISSNAFITPYDPGQTTKADEIQGFTNILQDSATHIGNQWETGFYKYLSDTNPQKNTNSLIDMGSIECINKGQLTMYPYELNDDYRLNNVSYKPMYSLNLVEDDNEDGESDVVVWYTYSNPWNPNGERCEYHVNDARDMYFMYTKGNITFINMSRNAYSSDLNYMKLLVNTMIASYEAGNHAPRVRIVDEPYVSGNDIETLYVMPVEYGEAYIPWDNEEEHSAKVNFYVSQAPPEAKIEVRFYCEVENEYDGWGNAEFEINRINWHVKQLMYGNVYDPNNSDKRTRNGITDMRNPLTNAVISEDLFHCNSTGGYWEWFEVKQNTVYQVELPIRIMDGNETKRVFVEARAIMKNPDDKEGDKGADIKSAMGYDSVVLVRPQLFNLD